MYKNCKACHSNEFLPRCDIANDNDIHKCPFSNLFVTCGEEYSDWNPLKVYRARISLDRCDGGMLQVWCKGYFLGKETRETQANRWIDWNGLIHIDRQLSEGDSIFYVGADEKEAWKIFTKLKK